MQGVSSSSFFSKQARLFPFLPDPPATKFGNPKPKHYVHPHPFFLFGLDIVHSMLFPPLKKFKHPPRRRYICLGKRPVPPLETWDTPPSLIPSGEGETNHPPFHILPSSSSLLFVHSRRHVLELLLVEQYISKYWSSEERGTRIWQITKLKNNKIMQNQNACGKSRHVSEAFLKKWKIVDFYFREL